MKFDVKHFYYTGNKTIEFPGFISYPIAGTLIRAGASCGVIATFMTALNAIDNSELQSQTSCLNHVCKNEK